MYFRRKLNSSIINLYITARQSLDKSYTSTAEPVFIFGCGRSGNTLLRSILVATGEIIIPPESYILPKLICRYPFSKNLSGNDILNIVSIFESHSDFHTWKFSKKTFFEYLEREDKLTLDRVLQCFYRSTEAAELADKYHLWGDKTPLNSLYASSLIKFYPNMYGIHLVRHPFDVALSYVNAGLMPSLKQAVLYWGLSNERILMAARSKKFLTIRYEDFVQKPDEHYQRLSNFLSLDTPWLEVQSNRKLVLNKLGDVNVYAHHQNVMQSINPRSIQGWRHKISPEDQEKLSSIIEKNYPKLVTQFNYELS